MSLIVAGYSRIDTRHFDRVSGGEFMVVRKNDGSFNCSSIRSGKLCKTPSLNSKGLVILTEVYCTGCFRIIE